MNYIDCYEMMSKIARGFSFNSSGGFSRGGGRKLSINSGRLPSNPGSAKWQARQARNRAYYNRTFAQRTADWDNAMKQFAAVKTENDRMKDPVYAKKKQQQYYQRLDNEANAQFKRNRNSAVVTMDADGNEKYAPVSRDQQLALNSRMVSELRGVKDPMQRAAIRAHYKGIMNDRKLANSFDPSTDTFAASGEAKRFAAAKDKNAYMASKGFAKQQDGVYRYDKSGNTLKEYNRQQELTNVNKQLGTDSSFAKLTGGKRYDDLTARKKELEGQAPAGAQQGKQVASGDVKPPAGGTPGTAPAPKPTTTATQPNKPVSGSPVASTTAPKAGPTVAAATPRRIPGRKSTYATF